MQRTFLHKRDFCPNDSIHGYHPRSLATLHHEPLSMLSKHKCTMGLRRMPLQPILTPVHGYHLSSHHLSTFLLRLSFPFINIMDSYGNIYPLTNPLVLITSCFAVVSSWHLLMRHVPSHLPPPLIIRLDGSLLS